MRNTLLALLFVVPAIASAQSRLTVRVESHGNPVVQAQVGTGIDFYATNAAGMARFTLRSGTHLVRVRMIGFKSDSFRVTLRAGADTIVKVELQPEATTLEPVFVNSTRGIKRVEDEPVRVEVLAREDVDEKTEMRPQDIKGLLSEMPGVRLQTTSAATGGAGIRLQGLKPHYSLMLADGLPLYGNGGIGLDLLQVPPADLQQVEVMKGAASALYGSNAIGGTINLISKRPADESDVLVNRTSQAGTNALGWISKKTSDHFGFTTVAGVHRQDGRDADGDNWMELPKVTRYEIRPRLFYAAPGGGSAFLTMGATSEDRVGGFNNGLAPDASSYIERAQTKRGDVGLSIDRVAGASGVIKFRGSFNVNSVDHTFGAIEEKTRRSTGLGEFSYSFTDMYNQFLAGASIDADMANVKGPSSTSASGTPIDYSWFTPAVFLQNTSSVTDNLSFTLTVRGDYHSEYGPFISPRLSILEKLQGDWSVRLSASRGFYAPTPFIEEIDPVGAHAVNGFGSGAARAVGAETAEYGSADLSGRVGPFQLNGTLFGTIIHHPVLASPAPGGRYTLSNSLNAHSARGIELMGAYDLEPLLITALYTYTDSRERADNVSTIETAAPYAPRHTGGVDIAWEEDDLGTRIALESFFTSRQRILDDPKLQVSKPYLLTGILLSQRIQRRYTLFANVENLADVKQTNYSQLVLPSRVPDGRWTATPWAPLEGRTLSVGLRVHNGGK